MKSTLKGSVILYLAALGLSSFVFTWVLQSYKTVPLLAPFKAVDRTLNDTAFRLRAFSNQATTIPLSEFVIVDIDDASIETLGRVQNWPRSYDAKVLQTIAAGNPVAVGLDILYTERDTLASSYATILEQKGFTNSTEILAALSTDRELIRAARNTPRLYLSLFDDELSQEPASVPDWSKLLRTLEAPPISENYPQLTSPVLPFKELRLQAEGTGTISISSDTDGIIRDYQLFQVLPDDSTGKRRLIANFPFYMLLDLVGLNDDQVTFTEEGLLMGAKTLPLTSTGTFQLNWLGSEEKFRTISYYKILQGRIPSAFFENKVVFLGTSAAGLQDIKNVPVKNSKMPGVEVHVTALLNMVNQSWMTTISMGDIAGILLVTALILQCIFYFFPPAGSFIIFILLSTLYSIIYVIYLFPSYHLLVDSSMVFSLMFFNFIGSVLYRYFSQERQKGVLKQAFQSYVAPDLVEEIMRDASKVTLGGEKKELSVLFSDIRGFTTYSETLDPQTLVGFLNRYLDRMGKQVMKHDGTIDKFIGDAVMAIFGAPVYRENHARKACLSALDMMRALKEFNQEMEIENAQPIDIGIGINTGEMTVGNIGSSNRFDYTVIGDAVNLAARLEGLNKYFGTHILVSEFTKNQCEQDEFIFREVATVAVKGKTLPVTLFELLEDNTHYQRYHELINTYTKGLRAYHELNFSLAEASFKECLHLHPNDGPSKLYLSKLAEVKENPSAYSKVLKMNVK